MKPNKKKKAFLWLVFLVVFFFFCAVLVFNNQIQAPSSEKKSVGFKIKPGESLEQVSLDLKEKSLVKNSFFFRLLLVKEGLAGKIQAGDFVLSPDMKALEVAQKLTAGFSDVQVTIPEGWRNEEIAQELSKNLTIKSSDFAKVAKEGEMFPDTYRFKFDATAADVADKMLANFQNKFDQKLKSDAAGQNLSQEEVLILASIVERESKFSQDRPIVAGILEKRLKLGMALEVDATLQYALGYSKEEKTWWRKNLTQDDLNLDSPYNTRKNVGLPPTPICNPGLDSINAVVYPKDKGYLYYVSDKNGKMYYAANLDDHIKNIQKYL